MDLMKITLEEVLKTQTGVAATATFSLTNFRLLISWRKIEESAYANFEELLQSNFHAEFLLLIKECICTSHSNFNTVLELCARNIFQKIIPRRLPHSWLDACMHAFPVTNGTTLPLK